MKITKLSEKNYYEIEYQIDSQDGQWTKIESGNINSCKNKGSVLTTSSYGELGGIAGYV